MKKSQEAQSCRKELFLSSAFWVATALIGLTTHQFLLAPISVVGEVITLAILGGIRMLRGRS